MILKNNIFHPQSKSFLDFNLGFGYRASVLGLIPHSSLLGALLIGSVRIGGACIDLGCCKTENTYFCLESGLDMCFLFPCSLFPFFCVASLLWFWV